MIYSQNNCLQAFSKKNWDFNLSNKSFKLGIFYLPKVKIMFKIFLVANQ